VKDARRSPASPPAASWSAWTIQPAGVWRALERRGEVFVDRRFYARANGRAFVPPAYRWLGREFARRGPGARGRLLWWAYGEKPDLRSLRHHLPRRGGPEHVRIELRVPVREALRFPAWAWDAVYCGWYLARDPDDWRSWKRACARAGREPVGDDRALPAPLARRVRASWSRLFRADLPRRGWRGSPYWRDASTCVVLERLRLDGVRGVHWIQPGASARRCQAPPGRSPAGNRAGRP